MRQFRIGMRWWLAGIFAMIGALTALLVASVSTSQVNSSVRGSAHDIAVGKAVSAAFSVEHAVTIGNLDKAVPVIARNRDLAVFVFGPDGRLISPSLSRGVRLKFVPQKDAALAAAISGHRFVQTSNSGTTVVGLPLGGPAAGGAIVAYAPRPPEYGKSLAIFHREVIRAAFWAVLIAFTVGLIAAMLISRRLRGIAAAAAAIEKGDFEARLHPRFRDEIGSLALTIDRMRRRLRDSFDRLSAERAPARGPVPRGRGGGGGGASSSSSRRASWRSPATSSSSSRTTPPPRSEAPSCTAASRCRNAGPGSA